MREDVDKDKGTRVLTYHGFLTLDDGTFTCTGSGAQCVIGKCDNGKGVRISKNWIEAGKFKDGVLKKGTKEVYRPIMNGLAGIFTTDDAGISGTFTPGGDEDAMDARMNGGDIVIDTKYYNLDDFTAKGPTKYATDWLQNIYMPYQYFMRRVDNKLAEFKAEDAAKFAREHPAPAYSPSSSKPYSKETDPFYYSPDQKRQMDATSRDMDQNGRGTCSCCGGTGSVGSGKTYMGRDIPQRCTCCYGTGRR